MGCGHSGIKQDLGEAEEANVREKRKETRSAKKSKERKNERKNHAKKERHGKESGKKDKSAKNRNAQKDGNVSQELTLRQKFDEFCDWFHCHRPRKTKVKKIASNISKENVKKSAKDTQVTINSQSFGTVGNSDETSKGQGTSGNCHSSQFRENQNVYPEPTLTPSLQERRRLRPKAAKGERTVPNPMYLLPGTTIEEETDTNCISHRTTLATSDKSPRRQQRPKAAKGKRTAHSFSSFVKLREPTPSECLDAWMRRQLQKEQ